MWNKVIAAIPESLKRIFGLIDKTVKKRGWHISWRWRFLALFLLAGCKNGDDPVDPSKHVDFAKTVWLHTDVSSWQETATLNVHFSGNLIFLDSNMSRVWPARAPIGGTPNINANAWVFVYRHEDQMWLAATWEWMRVAQVAKLASACEGGHIKHRELAGWRPVSGETYGFMVSGIARSTMRNVRERSNVVMIEWR